MSGAVGKEQGLTFLSLYVLKLSYVSREVLFGSYVDMGRRSQLYYFLDDGKFCYSIYSRKLNLHGHGEVPNICYGGKVECSILGYLIKEGGKKKPIICTSVKVRSPRGKFLREDILRRLTEVGRDLSAERKWEAAPVKYNTCFFLLFTFFSFSLSFNLIVLPLCHWFFPSPFLLSYSYACCSCWCLIFLLI